MASSHRKEKLKQSFVFNKKKKKKEEWKKANPNQPTTSDIASEPLNMKNGGYEDLEYKSKFLYGDI